MPMNIVHMEANNTKKWSHINNVGGYLCMPQSQLIHVSKIRGGGGGGGGGLCIEDHFWIIIVINKQAGHCRVPRTVIKIPRVLITPTMPRWANDHDVVHLQAKTVPMNLIWLSVSGLATDSPCGVWGRGWTTCLLHDSPLFGSHFKMRVGM